MQTAVSQFYDFFVHVWQQIHDHVLFVNVRIQYMMQNQIGFRTAYIFFTDIVLVRDKDLWHLAGGDVIPFAAYGHKQSRSKQVEQGHLSHMARAGQGCVCVVACVQSEALAQDVFDHETPVPGFK